MWIYVVSLLTRQYLECCLSVLGMPNSIKQTLIPIGSHPATNVDRTYIPAIVKLVTDGH